MPEIIAAHAPATGFEQQVMTLRGTPHIDSQSAVLNVLVTGALGYLLNLGFLLTEKKLIHWSGKA